MVPAESGDATAADWRVLNRVNWDDRVPIHLASRFYDLEGFRKTRDSLRNFEPAEAGDVRGKDLVHLQCHIGLDTLSWAGRGARASGPDFSVPAIEAARGLAAELGISASFVTSDVECVRLAGQAPVPGQEPGDGEPFGISEGGLDRGERG